jgi:predicted phosphodiesterase
MKIQVISDIHLEERDKIPLIKPDGDILFLAGDIGIIGNKIYEEFLQYCNDHWTTVLYVLGNHELYSETHSLHQLSIQYKDYIKQFNNITLLDHNICRFSGYVIIGCTLWGNFEKETHISGTPKKISIWNEDKLEPIGTSKITELHKYSYEWIKNNIHPTSPTIILTHFPVTLENDKVRQLRHREEDKEVLKEYGAEMNLTSDVGIICISGHTHYSHDFNRDGVRYISNQLGYPDEERDDICNYTDCVYKI